MDMDMGMEIQVNKKISKASHQVYQSLKILINHLKLTNSNRN